MQDHVSSVAFTEVTDEVFYRGPRTTQNQPNIWNEYCVFRF